MGSIFGGGSSSPSKPEMSQQEKTQHAVSAAEWDHYKGAYAPLEKEYLSDSQKNFEARGRAQADSAVMRQGTESLQLAALGGGTSKAAGSLSGALAGARTKATSEAQGKRDSRMAGALGVGRELAADTQSSLSALGRTGAKESINEMQNELKVDQARSSARAQTLGTLAGAGLHAYKKGGGGNQTNFMDQAATGGVKQRRPNPPTSMF